MQVNLVSMTQIAEDYLLQLMREAKDESDKKFIKNVQSMEGLMAYAARVSSPNQTNANYEKLLGYCAKHQHWSVFEMADITLEIKTSRAIAQQILRHRSFCFQEFSQRYAKANMGFEIYEARSQDNKNRQNSVDDMSDADKKWFLESQDKLNTTATDLYEEALNKGIAKEQARFLLPASTTTKIYMKGSIRSWIHYINLRAANGTQKEHADIAEAAKKILSKKIPSIAKAMGWV